ncbi:MAG: DUF4932 domain-containing protein, partial [Elusimicrobiota bacterium]
MKSILAVICILGPAFSIAEASASERRVGKLLIKTQTNTEVMYTLLNLAKTQRELRNWDKTPPMYAAVLRDFDPFQGHPAVKELEPGGKLAYDDGFSFDAFNDFPLHFSELPEGRRIAAYGEKLLRRVPGGKNDAERAKILDDYWEKIRDFYAASHFQDFLDKNKETYQSYIDDVYSSLPDFDAIGIQEDYHGHRGFDEFRLVPSPLALPQGANYGGMIEDSATHRKIAFNFMGIVEDEAAGRFGFRDKRTVEEMILHEFGHSFCNPVVDKHLAELEPFGFLFSGIAERMRRQAYSNWETVMRELLVRAVHSRYVLMKWGEEAAEKFLREDREDNQFVFIDDFHRLLGDYEKQREKFMTLDEFFPILAKSLAGWGVYPMDVPSPLGLKKTMMT